jgi:hypothetical protein
MPEQHLIYRWSPDPVEAYCPPGSVNAALAKLRPEAWNLAWLALPDPAHQKAPRGFRSALSHSLTCRATIGPHTLSMAQLLRIPARGFFNLAAQAQWNETPRLMEMDAQWREQWGEKADTARSEHPNDLNRTIDDAASNVQAARILLTRMGLAKTFATE